ncbi:hypothetical protein Q9Q99_14375 [Curtobacterium flaccumfaciens]|nr:hypothetical protein Q9Q99_14375 [Curtobacterium flaccumfaciens]
MFDGTDRQPAALGAADIRVTASQPGASRRDLALFDTTNPAITTTGALTAKTCASTDNLPAKQTLPACVSITSNAPDYTPAFLASSVPATPALHVTPTKAATGGQVHVPVAPTAGDFTGFQALSLRLTPDDTATTNADVSISLRDATGAVATRRVSDTSRAGQLLPGTRTASRKTILQQARIPLDAFTGIDLASVREVTIDVPQKNSGMLLSDLSLLPAATLGTPVVTNRPTARIADRFVDEGRTRTVVRAAVVLSRPAEQATTVSFDLDQASDNRIRPAMQAVTFQPGEVCRAVAVSVNGDRTPSFSRTADYPDDAQQHPGRLGDRRLDRHHAHPRGRRRARRERTRDRIRSGGRYPGRRVCRGPGDEHPDRGDAGEQPEGCQGRDLGDGLPRRRVGHRQHRRRPGHPHDGQRRRQGPPEGHEDRGGAGTGHARGARPWLRLGPAGSGHLHDDEVAVHGPAPVIARHHG